MEFFPVVVDSFGHSTPRRRHEDTVPVVRIEEVVQQVVGERAATRIIEPTAAQRIAPDAVRRLEEVFGDLSDNLF